MEKLFLSKIRFFVVKQKQRMAKKSSFRKMLILLSEKNCKAEEETLFLANRIEFKKKK